MAKWSAKLEACKVIPSSIQTPIYTKPQNRATGNAWARFREASHVAVRTVLFP